MEKDMNQLLVLAPNVMRDCGLPVLTTMRLRNNQILEEFRSVAKRGGLGADPSRPFDGGE